MHAVEDSPRSDIHPEDPKRYAKLRNPQVQVNGAAVLSALSEASRTTVARPHATHFAESDCLT